jgi:hypothetical protein
VNVCNVPSGQGISLGHQNGHHRRFGDCVVVWTKPISASLCKRAFPSLVRIGTYSRSEGQWFIKRATADEEAADNPAKDTSTASLFQSSQENGAIPPP